MSNIQSLNKMDFSADISKLDNVRKFIKDKCLELSIDDITCYQISLAIEEAFVNLVKHSFKNDNSNNISITLSKVQTYIKITLEDNGPSFDPRSILPVELKQVGKKFKKGGLGVFLISKIMNQIDYEPKSKLSPTNKLILTKILE